MLPDEPGAGLVEPFTHLRVLFLSVSLIEDIVPRVSLSFLFSYHDTVFRRLIAKSFADKPVNNYNFAVCKSFVCSVIQGFGKRLSAQFPLRCECLSG